MDITATTGPPLDNQANASGQSTSSLHRRRTLYLVRHGEALHNVKEVEAQERAKLEARELGLSATETTERVEAARKAVLQDCTLFDAPLTDVGREQAKKAGQRLAQIIDDGLANAPTEAMVSPLSRCLETADILLHQHLNSSQEMLRASSGSVHSSDEEDDDDDNKNTDKNAEHKADAGDDKDQPEPRPPRRRNTLLVHIRPELRERQTQYPPDTPQTPVQLLHWTQQKVTKSEGTNGGFRFHAKALTGHELAVEESRTQLRERASKLFNVLMEMKHRHVLIISHKGYLREMERGLLGLTDAEAPLFKNAEVRVYRVVFTKRDRTLESLERLA